MVNGFRLAGISKGAIVERSEDAKKIIDAFLLKNELSIIIITEKIYHDLENFILDIKTKKRNPIIIAVPEMSGPRTDVVNLKNLLKTMVL